METLENKPYTFWELLNKVGIKIPIIQRDYAQGRNTNNVKRIRENFLNTLYKTLEEEKQLDLDFVYGSVKDNYLIPLDGQQRLTTLFLLHYFLALKENKLNDNIKEILKKFTYETRISSREFIKQLIEKNINLDERKISEIIKDQTWFFSEWENDPTITSMLNMLDSIQEKFKNTENFFEKLINKRIITFSFLNLKEFKLTDELYVKMNARGKPLTEFENFKSKFEECINKANELKEREKIKAKFDNEWLDFFWNKTIEELEEKKQPNSYSLSSETDKKFYNFFYNITFIFYLETLKNEEKLKLNNREFSTIKEFIDNISIFDFYQEVYKNPEKIKEIEKILDNLEKIEKKLNSKNDKEIFKKIISTKNIGQNEIAKFYSVVLGIIYELNSQEFNRWVRVTFNLINNQLIQSSKDLIKAIQALRNLITKSSKDIYDYIAKSSENIEYFSEIQKKEESLKACLILNNLSYENEFIKAENHWYLKGQIGFLISYTAKNDYFDVKEFKKYDINHLKEKYSKEFNINEFNKYRDKFIKLWDFTKDNNKSIKKNEILIHRALLTFGDYTKLTQNKNRDKYTFCNFGIGLREKNENWRKVFGSKIFKKFLDSININDNLNIKLKKLIDSYYFKCDDWKSYIINPNKNWSVLDETKHYQFYKKNNIIRLNRGDVSVTSWQWRRFYDLYNYYLYRLLRYDLKIIENTSFNRIEPLADIEYPCFYIDKCYIQNHHFALDIFFEPKTNKFLIRFFDRNKREISQNLLEFLQNNKFKKNKYTKIREYGYWNDEYELCKMEELIKFLKTFLKEIINHI